MDPVLRLICIELVRFGFAYVQLLENLLWIVDEALSLGLRVEIEDPVSTRPPAASSRVNSDPVVNVPSSPAVSSSTTPYPPVDVPCSSSTENANDFSALRPRFYSSSPTPPTEYYAVVEGRNPGIYDSWGTAHAQVNRYRGQSCKGGFRTRAEAEEYYIHARLEILRLKQFGR